VPRAPLVAGNPFRARNGGAGGALRPPRGSVTGRSAPRPSRTFPRASAAAPPQRRGGVELQGDRQRDRLSPGQRDVGAPQRADPAPQPPPPNPQSEFRDQRLKKR